MATETPARPRTLSHAWDDALVARVVAGEHEAWRAFHRHYFPIAAAFLQKLGVRRVDVEDACQEVFLQVHRYLPRFRGEANVKTWLYRLCITEARKVRRRRWIAHALDRVFAIAPAQAAQTAVPPTMSTDHRLQVLVLRALDEMSEGERLAFVLFEMEGLSGKEVAEITRSSLPSVWRRLFQARQIFRRALGDDEPAGAS